MRTLTSEQVETLFEASTDDRFRPLWVTLVTTGLRLGEATGLQWSDIDLDGARLTVRRALQRQRGAGLVLVEPKTSRSRRTLHLSAVTVAALREQRHRQTLERLAADVWNDRGLVFSTTTGNPIDPPFVSLRLGRALRKAGLPRVRVHDLRHTFATLMLARGVHPKVVQEMLGHSTITLTLDTYSHTTPALHLEASRQMDTLFGGQVAALVAVT